MIAIGRECATLGWNTQQHKDTMHSLDNNPPARCGMPSNFKMIPAQNGSLNQGVARSGNSATAQKSWSVDSTDSSPLTPNSAWSEIDAFLNENENNTSSNDNKVTSSPLPTTTLQPSIILNTPNVRNLRVTTIPPGRKILKVYRPATLTAVNKTVVKPTAPVKTPVFDTPVDNMTSSSRWNSDSNVAAMSSTSLATLNGNFPSVVSCADDLTTAFQGKQFSSNKQSTFLPNNTYVTRVARDVSLSPVAPQYEPLTPIGTDTSVVANSSTSPMYHSSSVDQSCNETDLLMSLSDTTVGQSTPMQTSTQMADDDYRVVSMMDVLPTHTQTQNNSGRGLFHQSTSVPNYSSTSNNNSTTAAVPQQHFEGHHTVTAVAAATSCPVDIPTEKPTYVSDHIQSGHSALNELVHSPTTTTPYGSTGQCSQTSNGNHQLPQTSTMSPQVQQPQPYSTIDLTTLGQASPVRHDVEVASTSHQQQRDLSPYYNLSSSPGPSSPLSCNGSVSSPQPHGRKRMHNNQACRDSRKKKKVKREELKEKEIELIADNEVQRKKIAQLEVEVAKTRDIILKLMVRGAARS